MTDSPVLPQGIRVRWLSLVRNEHGMTVLELTIAMLITSLIAAVMLAWVIGVVTTDQRHDATDLALGDLRDVSDLLSRDLRSAEYLTVADADELTYWLDGDRDGVIDDGETVTWAIKDDGSIIRSTDDGVETTLATALSPTATQFSYDSSTPANVTRVTLSLVGSIASGGQDEALEYVTDVYLRNSNLGTIPTGGSGGSGTTTTTSAGSTTTTQGGVELVVYKLSLKLDEDEGESEGKVTVKDSGGSKISGVTVYVRWSVSPGESGYPYTMTGVTDSKGEVKIVLIDDFADGTDIEFCVINLVKSGYFYDNGDECDTEEWDD